MYAARLAFIPAALPSFAVPLVAPVSVAPSRLYATHRAPAIARLPRRQRPVACDRDAPVSSASSPSTGGKNPGTSSESRTANSVVSRTLIGRALVELLSLVVGALLLLVVVAWRASQVVSAAAWRALVWLSNLRRLGKWACVRAVQAQQRLPAGAALRAARDAFFTILTRQEPQPVVQRDEDIQEMDSIRDVTATEETAAADEHLSHIHTVADKRRLVLVRHAKTLWDHASEVPDHDRVLSTQGKEEARLVGAELAARAWVPNVVLCSDAVRTVQTLSLLNVPEKEAQPETLCTESLYYAVTGDEMAMAVDDALGGKGFVDRSTLMVVCHNPGCEELVEQLTGHRPEMGTGCAAMLEYEGGDDEDDEDDKNGAFRLAPQQKRWGLVEVLRPSTLSATSSASSE